MPPKTISAANKQINYKLTRAATLLTFFDKHEVNSRKN